MDITIDFLSHPEEINQIIELQTQSLREICSRDYTPRQIESLIKSQAEARYDTNEIVLLGKYGQEIVGFGTIGRHSPLICGLFVHPRYIGLGIGKKLLKQIEQIAIDKQYKALLVFSSKTAEKFYGTQGYQKIARQSGYIETILFKKQLIPLTWWEKIWSSSVQILLFLTICFFTVAVFFPF